MSRRPEAHKIGGGGAAASAGMLFEQQLGALIGSWLLAQRPFHQVFGLGDAAPVWLRFETESPVDDILIATSAGGFVAIQAKTKVSLSRKQDSPFSKTISQFVRHWLACRDGDGALQWNRPLDPEVDRLILAVSRAAPASVQNDLADALRLKAQPGGGELNQAQARAFADFEFCAKQAWGKATAMPYDTSISKKLAGLIRILPFDPIHLEREAALTNSSEALARPEEAASAWDALVSLCGELMAKRGGVDLGTLRQELMARGLALRAPPDYREDIARLQAHSQAIAEHLERYEVIEATPGEQVTVERECQTAILEAANNGSLLIIGEPGVGKSGVLNGVARDLRSHGSDVLELAVDRYSVETLEGLARELCLRHGLIETLEAWDGPAPGWIIVDALDATRGGTGEGVFRTLIERVMESGGRWRVIASIRTFDLRMGQQFRALFKGKPPVEDLKDPGFSNVRHVCVPRWSKAEFVLLLDRVPALAAALDNAPRAFRDLAMVPFNTRLICDLIKDRPATADFSNVGTQAELLQLYWEHRVESHGAPAYACVRRVVEAMVTARALRVPLALAAAVDPAILDTLERESVLVSTDQRRWVQFRHHLLFDFSAARVLLTPDGLTDGTLTFPKGDASGLMLAPALTFLMRELWERDFSRSDFWSAAAYLLADTDGDPVIRSAIGRICAEYPCEPQDLTQLARRITTGDDKAAQAFVHISGALAIRLEDHPETPLGPWTTLARELASNVEPVVWTVRSLLFRMIGGVMDEAGRADIGTTARALLQHALTLDDPYNLVVAAIDLVGDTYSTDPTASRVLLERVFEPQRLEVFAAQEVPALCRKIEAIAAADPEFASRIYKQTYTFSITERRETKISDSQILTLTSDARQDYDLARYTLSEFIASFLVRHPDHAVSAIDGAVEAYVEREHPRNADMLDVEIVVGARRVRLREDGSVIWAHDPDVSYGHDGTELVKKLLEFLRNSEPVAASDVAKRLIATASLAIFWSRLFLVAAERGDALLELLLEIAMRQEFLTLPDTRKDAVDIVARGYNLLEPDARTAFETGVAAFDFSRFQRPQEARASFERRLFGAIGEARLASDHARAIAAECAITKEVRNERLFAIQTGYGPTEPYHWIENLDRVSPDNQRLMAAIETIEQTLEVEADAEDSDRSSLTARLDAMEALAAEIDRATQNEHLIVSAEGQIALGLAQIVKAELTPAAENARATDRFLALLRLIFSSEGPRLYDHTEDRFEQNASWDSPAPRVDAAGIALDLMLQRGDLYAGLEPDIDALLEDRHPAVRLRAALGLVRIWDLDREGFWRRLDGRLKAEPNQGVIDLVAASVLGRVLHADPPRVERLLLALRGRFAGEPERQARMREKLADLLAILWVTYQRERAHEVLVGWTDAAAAHVPELSKVLGALRHAFVAGLHGEANADDDGLRHRSHALAHTIVLRANDGLTAHSTIAEPSETQMEQARGYAMLLDTVCRQLYFGSGAFRDRGDAEPTIGNQELERFFIEVAPTLEAIGDFATPHTVHYLLELLEYLLPLDPARAFDLTAHALRSGGQRTGYQFESLGADLFVRLVGVFLADYKKLFDDAARRDALIECLEIFMNAGWPAARRLLYRLPELVQ